MRLYRQDGFSTEEWCLSLVFPKCDVKLVHLHISCKAHIVVMLYEYMIYSVELLDTVFLRPCHTVLCWQGGASNYVDISGSLSESITGCQTRRDHIIITRLAYSGLLNCGNSLVKSDVSMAPLSSVRALEQWESEDEPQGTGTWDGRGNRHCQ